MATTYSGYKYCGGTYCGCIQGQSTIEQVMEFSDDGFCDYVRIMKEREDGTVQVMKVHFEPSDRDDEWYSTHFY